MPEWLKNLIEKIKSLNPNLTEDQMKELETVASAGITKPAPAGNPGAQSTGTDMDALVTRLEALIDAKIKPIADRVTEVRDYTTSQLKDAADRTKAATIERYRTHVDKLFNDKKITKAERDAHLNLEDEKVKSRIDNADALATFIEYSEKMPVNQALAGGKTGAAQQPGTPPSSDQFTAPAGGRIDMGALREAAKQEIVANSTN